MASAGAADPALCGQVYEATLDRSGRRAGGVFYTPPHLVDTVFGMNKSWRLLWKGWKPIGHHQTLVVSQLQPEVEINCP